MRKFGVEELNVNARENCIVECTDAIGSEEQNTIIVLQSVKKA